MDSRLHPRASASVDPDGTCGPALAKPLVILVLGLSPVEDPGASPGLARATSSPQSALMGQLPSCPELGAPAGSWALDGSDD